MVEKFLSEIQVKTRYVVIHQKWDYPASRTNKECTTIHLYF